MGYVYSFDISIPLDRFYEIVELTREKLKDVTDCKAVSGFGHIGEFKINYNPIQVNNLYKQKVLVYFYFKNLKRKNDSQFAYGTPCCRIYSIYSHLGLRDSIEIKLIVI